MTAFSTTYNSAYYHGVAPCKYNDYVDCNNGDIKRNKCKHCGWCPVEAHKRKKEIRRIRRINSPHKYVFEYPEVM